MTIQFLHQIIIWQYVLFSSDVQVTLLRKSWVDMFALGLAQSSHLVSVSTIISSLTNFMNNAIAQDKMTASKLKRLSEHIWKINEFIQEMNRLQTDDYEYAFLRFITIFNACEYSKCVYLYMYI